MQSDLANDISTADAALSRYEPIATARPARVRLEFLDVLRAFCALAVLLEHGCERFFAPYLIWANNHFTLGVFGVSGFFLVSGFIIPVSLERYKSLPKFWVARFFRLYPIYWASILFLFVYAALGWVTLPTMMHSQPFRLILANLGMVQLFVNTPNIMGLFWTLSMELIFYLLCSAALFVGLISRSLLWAWVAVLGNLVLNLSVGLFLHRSIPAGRTALIVTAFFATLVYRAFNKQITFTSIYRLLPVLAVSLLTGFWFRFAVYPVTEKDGRFTFLGVSMSYLGAYLLFFALYSLRHLEFPKPLLWLGRISYSLYLMHGFILVIIPTGPLPWLRLAVVIVLAIGLSSLTFMYIEQPALALQRQLKRQPALA